MKDCKRKLIIDSMSQEQQERNGTETGMKRRKLFFELKPFPEIALGSGCDGAPHAVHLDAEGLDLSDIFLDGEGEIWRIDGSMR